MLPKSCPRSLCYAAAFVLLALTGCSTWSYDQIRIGQAPREYEKLLPAYETRRTPLGLCYYSTDSIGGQDVIMILVSHNRRVAGKLRVTLSPPEEIVTGRLGLRAEGEIASTWLGAESTGPIDTLRYLLTRLLEYPADLQTLRAHGWVVAAVARILEQQPDVSPVTSLPTTFEEELERVPAGGAADLRSAEDRIRFHYSQPRAR